MHLFHNSKETIRLLDSEGRTYVIPANVAWPVPALQGTDCNGTQAYAPFSISAEKMAKFLCDEGVHYGLVVVPETSTPTGIQFNLAKAARRSANARQTAEDGVLQRYIKGAKEDELAKLPVKPPSASIAAILDARGLDLKRDYGLQPVGYRVGDAAAARDTEMANLRAENETQRKEISEIKEMLTMLMEDRKDEKRKKVTA